MASRLPAVRFLMVGGVTYLKDLLIDILNCVSPRFVLLVSIFSFRSFLFALRLATSSEDSLTYSLNSLSQLAATYRAPHLNDHQDLEYNVPNALPDILPWWPYKPTIPFVLSISKIIMSFNGFHYLVTKIHSPPLQSELTMLLRTFFQRNRTFRANATDSHYYILSRSGNTIPPSLPLTGSSQSIANLPTSHSHSRAPSELQPQSYDILAQCAYLI